MRTFTQTIVNDMKHRLTSLSALAGTLTNAKDGRTRHLRWDDGKFALKEYDDTIVFEKIKDAK